LRLALALFLCILTAGNGRASTGGSTQDHQVFLPLVSVNVYAPPMKIVDTAVGRMKYGGYVLEANLQNQGPDPVYDVSVRADFFTEQGQWLTAYTGTALLPATFPGHFNAVDFRTGIDDSLYPNIGFELRVISWTLERSAIYWPLTVIDFHAYASDTDVIVQAAFRNDSPYPLQDVRTLVWEVHQFNGLSSEHVTGAIGVGETFTQTWVLWNIYESRLPGIKIEGQGVAAP